MSFGIGSRTYYATWKNILFNFEYKRDRDYFVDNAIGAKAISASDAYKLDMLNRIKVCASCSLKSNKSRKERINKWYADKRCCV